jgi:hypothetical protein
MELLGRVDATCHFLRLPYRVYRPICDAWDRRVLGGADISRYLEDGLSRSDDPHFEAHIDHCAEVEDSEIEAWEEMTGRKLSDLEHDE